MQVSIKVKSNYHKQASLGFAGGAYDDFGVTDNKGMKYKFSSYEGPGGIKEGVNKGFSRIADLQFGRSKPMILIAVRDTLHNGQSETLSFKLPKTDKDIKMLKEAHIMSTLMLNYTSAGQRMFQLKNIPVTWIKPAITRLKKGV